MNLPLPESEASDGQPRLSFDEAARLNQRVDAFVELFPEAFARSPAKDAATGPLSGLSFGVKEVVDQRGHRTPWGVPWMRNCIPNETASVVTRIAKAGATCVGTTRSTQFALAGDSGTKNPWDPTRTPGGSSAGSGAAVAAGLADFCIGTQTIGSVIRPAAYCGVAGIKPTFGRLPRDRVLLLSDFLDHVGLIARDVETLAAVYDLFADPSESRAGASRVLVPEIWFDSEPCPQVRAALARARDVLAAEGLAVRDVTLPGDVRKSEERTTTGLLARGLFSHHGGRIEANADRLPSKLVELVHMGAGMSEDDFVDLVEERTRIARLMNAAVDDGSVILTVPTVDLPPKLGEGTGNRDPQRLWTLIGWPAVTVPVEFSADPAGVALPFGIQLVGKPDTDAALLETAARLQRALGPIARPPRD